MRQKSNSNALSSEEMVKGIRRATRKRYSAEEKIRIVLDGLRGEHSIAELCRREGIATGPPLSPRVLLPMASQGSIGLLEEDGLRGFVFTDKGAPSGRASASTTCS